jgi:hypothetical protein
MVAMDLDAYDHPAANRELLCDARFNLNTAPASCGDDPNEHEHPLVVDIELALGLKAC